MDQLSQGSRDLLQTAGAPRHRDITPTLCQNWDRAGAIGWISKESWNETFWRWHSESTRVLKQGKNPGKFGQNAKLRENKQFRGCSFSPGRWIILDFKSISKALQRQFQRPSGNEALSWCLNHPCGSPYPNTHPGITVTPQIPGNGRKEQCPSLGNAPSAISWDQIDTAPSASTRGPWRAFPTSEILGFCESLSLSFY